MNGEGKLSAESDDTTSPREYNTRSRIDNFSTNNALPYLD